ncbi:MAG: hypothetical protein J0L97_05395 [Alphaproteobacteria bacterium]|nr:hypothetical protein [Alphaproteobacteria bacterium]
MFIGYLARIENNIRAWVSADRARLSVYGKRRRPPCTAIIRLKPDVTARLELHHRIQRQTFAETYPHAEGKTYAFGSRLLLGIAHGLDCDVMIGTHDTIRYRAMPSVMPVEKAVLGTFDYRMVAGNIRMLELASNSIRAPYGEWAISFESQRFGKYVTLPSGCSFFQF